MFLDGDSSYTERLMVHGVVDGVSPHDDVARQTLERIRTLAAERPLVYLPSHDPESRERLRWRTTVGCARTEQRGGARACVTE